MIAAQRLSRVELAARVVLRVGQFALFSALVYGICCSTSHM